MSENNWHDLEELMDTNKNELFYFDIVKDDIEPNDKIEDIIKYPHCFKRTFKEIESNEIQSEAIVINRKKEFKFK